MTQLVLPSVTQSGQPYESIVIVSAVTTTHATRDRDPRRT
jgi:hypothetical protein